MSFLRQTTRSSKHIRAYYLCSLKPQASVQVSQATSFVWRHTRWKFQRNHSICMVYTNRLVSICLGFRRSRPQTVQRWPRFTQSAKSRLVANRDVTAEHQRNRVSSKQITSYSTHVAKRNNHIVSIVFYSQEHIHIGTRQQNWDICKKNNIQAGDFHIIYYFDDRFRNTVLWSELWYKCITE